MAGVGGGVPELEGELCRSILLLGVSWFRTDYSPYS